MKTINETFDLIIKNGEIINSNKSFKADVGIIDGIIAEVGENLQGAKRIIDATGLKVLPGLIDSQVHFREPGLTHKETIEAGSKAAVLGGICTFFEMPNTKPATTTCEAILKKIEIAKKKSYANAYFYIGGTADNLEELVRAQNIEGCCGVKIFLGSSTGDLLLYDKEKLLNIFKNIKVPIALHCESEEVLKERSHIKDNAKDVHAHYEWRNPESAFRATKEVLEIARAANKKVHILHVTTKEEAEFLKSQKDICTFEITPQHLTFSAPEIYDQIGTFAQMNPPIRTKEHQDALWKAVDEDYVDVFGSDHAPHTKEEKNQKYPNTPSGMPGVQTIFPVMLYHMNKGKITLSKIVEKMSLNPAKMFGLNKGSIEKGRDADFTLVDLEKKWIIKNEDQASLCGWTPFSGMVIKGKPIATIVSGEIAMLRDEVFKTKK